MPIGWYQQHQVCAIDALQEAARAKLGSASADFSVRGGQVVAKVGGQRAKLGTPQEFFRKADSCARR